MGIARATPSVRTQARATSPTARSSRHYYGNTTLETLGTAPAPASFDGGNVIVAMTENNGDDLIATAAVRHA